MKLTTMKRLKTDLGFTNEWISEKSGVPLGTVQKVFGEQVKSPRKETIDKLSHFFDMVFYEEERDASMVHDTEAAYNAIRKNKVTYRTIDGAVEVEEGVYRNPDRPFTIEDLQYVPEDKTMELIDGVLYDVNGPSMNHQRIIREVTIQISNCIDESDKDCEVFFAPLCVQVSCDNTTMVLPDLFIVCGKSNDGRTHIFGAPEFIMEVLSRTTMKKDMTVKLHKYWDSGVKEYWIVNPKKEKVTVYDFEHDDLDHQYSFDDKVPVGISEGKCEIDFGKIKKKLTEMGEDW